MRLDVGDISAALARSVVVLGEGPALLPSSGPFQKWVLERPLTPAVLCIVIAAVAWYILRSQGKARQGAQAAGVLALVGIAIYVTGSVVQTTGEKLMLRTRELVNAVAAADPTRVGTMLASDAVAMPWGFDRDVILARLESDLGRRFVIKQHSIHELRAAIDGANAARTQVRVRVVTDALLYEAPVGSWWMISWRKDNAGEWTVRETQMQQLDGVSDVTTIRP